MASSGGEVVPYQGGNGHSESIFSGRALRNYGGIVSNLFFEAHQTPIFPVFGVNIALRGWTIWKAWQTMHSGKTYTRDYITIAANLCALTVLPLQKGIVVAIAVDLIAECLIRYVSAKQQKKSDGSIPGLDNVELDCTIVTNALKVMGLTMDEIKDRSTIDDRYGKLRGEYTRSLNGLRGNRNPSQPMIAQFERLLRQVEAAYNTLLQEGGHTT